MLHMLIGLINIEVKGFFVFFLLLLLLEMIIRGSLCFADTTAEYLLKIPGRVTSDDPTRLSGFEIFREVSVSFLDWFGPCRPF